MTDDERWKRSGEVCGWKLPEPAHWFKRLPVIRRFRYVWLLLVIERHYSMFPTSLRTGYDEWVLYAIGRGWC